VKSRDAPENSWPFTGSVGPRSHAPGRADQEIWQIAIDHDFAVVTTNARDLIGLLEVDVHPGLIVLRESGMELSRDEQWRRIQPVVEYVKDSVVLVRLMFPGKDRVFAAWWDVDRPLRVARAIDAGTIWTNDWVAVPLTSQPPRRSLIKSLSSAVSCPSIRCNGNPLHHWSTPAPHHVHSLWEPGRCEIRSYARRAQLSAWRESSVGDVVATRRSPLVRRLHPRPGESRRGAIHPHFRRSTFRFNL
jgi:Domain of unknown function (DUF5615)